MARTRTPASFFLARGFLGLCTVGGALLLIGAIVSVFSGGELSRELDLGRGHRMPDPVTGHVKGASLAWTGAVSVTIEHPSRWLTLLNATPTILNAAAMIAAALLLLVVVVDIQRGSPFDSKAALRLRLAAAATGVAALTHPFVAAWADNETLAAAGRNGRGFTYEVYSGIGEAAPWLVVAALLAVFAHAFHAGQRLIEDTEGLV